MLNNQLQDLEEYCARLEEELASLRFEIKNDKNNLSHYKNWRKEA